jgi:hypothetical protein
MSHDLMPMEVEIDPAICAAALCATKRRAIELARGIEVVDGEGEMEWRQGHARTLLAAWLLLG